MNKKEQLRKQAQDLLKKARELEMQEQLKIGKLVLALYEKNEIKDSFLREEISKIVGDTFESTVNGSKPSALSTSPEFNRA